MRIFSNAMEMVREVERDLFEMGIRYQSDSVQDTIVSKDPKFKTIELTGYAYELAIHDHTDLVGMLDYMNVNIEWLTAERRERLLGTDEYGDPVKLNPGQAWQCNSELWGRFLRDGLFSYSYAERWQEQLPYIINELRQRPNTRQAVLTMYDRHQDMLNWGGRDRVPCSLTYHFLLRDLDTISGPRKTLSLVYNQRSCDYIKFFASDVFLTICLLKHVADQLNCATGSLTHFIGSLHAFARDLQERNIF